MNSPAEPEDLADLMGLPWRVGRKLGRTVYAMDGEDDNRNCDTFLGIMDTRTVAEHIVEAHNAALDQS